MCWFCKKKKKKNYTAIKVIAIVFASIAALAGAYVIFEKFFKEKVVKFINDKKAAKQAELADDQEEVIEADAAEEAEAVEEAAE